MSSEPYEPWVIESDFPPILAEMNCYMCGKPMGRHTDADLAEHADIAINRQVLKPQHPDITASGTAADSLAALTERLRNPPPMEPNPEP